MLSKACIVGTYQRKLEELVALAPQMRLTLAVPPAWKDERGVTTLERAHTEGYRLEVLPIALNGAFHLHFYPTLGRLVREVQPDVVHIDEEPYNLATFHANWVARRHGARTLWFSWQNLQRRYPPPFSWMERYNLRHVDHAIAGSQSAAAIWRAKGYTGPLSVIPQFGVDPEIFAPPARTRPAYPVHIAYVGRLVPEKGVDLLLQALASLAGDWHATVLGGGPEEARLRALARDHDLEDRVTFHGPVPSVEMPAFYRAIDVLVLPSRARPNWVEQFGRVLVEAMACGVAVVGSNIGEIPHVVGNAGLLFPEDDVAALRACLARLVDRPILRSEFGQRGRARVMQRFTQRSIARRTLAVYREILA
jgi:glycosyltransferase involved in cell wall biosynthesis